MKIIETSREWTSEEAREEYEAIQSAIEMVHESYFADKPLTMHDADQRQRQYQTQIEPMVRKAARIYALHTRLMGKVELD